jgi:hypothetical protein
MVRIYLSFSKQFQEHTNSQVGEKMSARISQKQVDLLREDIKEHCPNLVIFYKDEPLPKGLPWTIRFTFWIAALVGRISPGFKKSWNENISNGYAAGKTGYMAFPSRNDYSDWTVYGVFKIVRHEYVHVRDALRLGVWFNLLYTIFPLPLVVSGRAALEFRGYAQDLIVCFERFGTIPDNVIDNCVRHFSSALYVWMFPFEGLVRRRFEALRDDIYSGKVQGYYPDLKFFRDLSRD